MPFDLLSENFTPVSLISSYVADLMSNFQNFWTLFYYQLQYGIFPLAVGGWRFLSHFLSPVAWIGAIFLIKCIGEFSKNLNVN